jgi:hypothetical protein
VCTGLSVLAVDEDWFTADSRTPVHALPLNLCDDLPTSVAAKYDRFNQTTMAFALLSMIRGIPRVFWALFDFLFKNDIPALAQLQDEFIKQALSLESVLSSSLRCDKAKPWLFALLHGVPIAVGDTTLAPFVRNGVLYSAPPREAACDVPSVPFLRLLSKDAPPLVRDLAKQAAEPYGPKMFEKFSLQHLASLFELQHRFRCGSDVHGTVPSFNVTQF